MHSEGEGARRPIPGWFGVAWLGLLLLLLGAGSTHPSLRAPPAPRDAVPPVLRCAATKCRAPCGRACVDGGLLFCLAAGLAGCWLVGWLVAGGLAGGLAGRGFLPLQVCGACIGVCCSRALAGCVSVRLSLPGAAGTLEAVCLSISVESLGSLSTECLGSLYGAPGQSLSTEYSLQYLTPR